MKLVLISDTHGYHEDVKLPEGDILVHAGDFTVEDHGKGYHREFLKWINKQPFKDKVFIAGNHELAYEKFPEMAKNLREEFAPSCTYLEDSGATIQGLKFWGSPVTPRFYDWAFNRDRGAAIKAHWDNIPLDTNILITHGPCVGILDKSSFNGQSVGCDDLYNRIVEVGPKLHVCGHVHGGRGLAGLYTTKKYVTCVNAAICNEAYKPVNQPIVVELI